MPRPIPEAVISFCSLRGVNYTLEHYDIQHYSRRLLLAGIYGLILARTVRIHNVAESNNTNVLSYFRAIRRQTQYYDNTTKATNGNRLLSAYLV